METSELVDRMQLVLRDAGVLAAYLFGSRAGGAARPDNDVDVAVLPGAAVGLLGEQAFGREARPRPSACRSTWLSWTVPRWSCAAGSCRRGG